MSLERNILFLDHERFNAKKIAFNVELTTNFPDQLCWGVRVECEGMSTVCDDGIPEQRFPALSCCALDLPVTDWRRLPGQVIYSTENDAEPAILYLDLHEPLEISQLTFLDRDEARFDIDWQFKSRNGSGRIRFFVDFSGITLWFPDVQTTAQAMERLSRHLDLKCVCEPTISEYQSEAPTFRFLPRL